MSRFQSHAIFLSVLVLALLAMPAYPTTITTYSSQSSWQAATTGDQSINFEGSAPSGSYTTFPSFTSSGVQFFGLSGTTFGAMDTSAFSWANFGSNDALFSSGGTQGFHIVLPSAVTAFGLNLFTSPPAVSYTASVAGSQYTAPTSNQPTEAFFGVTSDTAFTTIDLTAQPGASYAFIDNFQWGTSQVSGGGGGGGGDAPEASTLLMIGTGLLSLALIRRRKAAHRT
jgi:hypothetical protein